MKIKVANLEPNPYREIGKYPIERKKVEGLKNSMREKEFFGSIPVRKHKDKYQIACGHHRLVALKELDIKEVECDEHNYTDAQMIKVMAEENFDWDTPPAVLIQTLIQTKKFLDDELAKFKTLKLAGDFAAQLFESQQAFANAKRKDTGGVGRETLIKFLGENWKSHKIREALTIIKDDTIDKEAINDIPTVRQAATFRKAVNECSTPKDVQKVIAKDIAEKGIGYRDIPAEVEKHAPPLPALYKKKAKKKERTIPNIGEFTLKLRSNINVNCLDLKKLIPAIECIENSKDIFRTLIRSLQDFDKLSSKFQKLCKEQNDGQKNQKTKRVVSTQILG